MTKKYKKKKWITLIMSVICWLGTLGVLLVTGLADSFALQAEPETVTLGSQLVDLFMPLLVTYAVAIIAVFFIREKLRNTVWLANVLLSALFFSGPVVYIVCGLYVLDEFVLVPLFKYFKNKVSINVEIDKRIGD